MKVRGKRPALEAKQFGGLKAGVAEIMDFLGIPEKLGEYVPASIKIRRGPRGITVRDGDWVVKDHDGLLLVIPDAEFHRRYEPAE